MHALKVSFVSIVLISTSWPASADGPPADDPNAQRTAAANATKAEWEARKAKLDYQQAAAPGSGLTTNVTTAELAGSLESAVLMSRALQPIGKHIATKVEAIVNTEKVLLFAGDESTDTSLWELFRYRTMAIDDRFSALETAGEGLDERYRAMTPATVQARVETAVKQATEERSLAAGLGAGLEAWSTAFSYFATEYTAGGIALAEDDAMLVAAVAANGLGMQLYRSHQLPQKDAGKEIFETLDNLGQRAEVQKVWGIQGKLRSANLTKRAENDKPNAEKLLQLAADYDAATALNDAAIATHSALLDTLSSTAADNPMPLAKMLEQKALADLIETSKYALFVGVYEAQGAYFTRKNLWTGLGAMPFYVSGGAVAHFQLFDSTDSRIVSSGIVSAACSYRKVTKVVGTVVHPSCAASESGTP